MIFYTVTCTCGWEFGPARKKIAKQYLSLHKEIHKFEGNPIDNASTSE